jgi:large subunit ribosomal protein L29
MRKMSAYENLSIEDLEEQYIAFSKEIYEIKTAFNMTKKMENPHILKKRKKDRARVMTILNQKRVKI